jgi:segregation and condensation protein A
MDYQVNLATFHGPLDLLLYLVKRHELDIRDIPIARVAEQFQDYLNALRWIDVEQAGDFLVMAATLMEIKSKMLLPREEADPAPQADPRVDLVKQLLAYKQFKDAAALLEARAEQQSLRLARQPPEAPAGPDPAKQPLRPVELWDLIIAFGRLTRETLSEPTRPIVVDQTPLPVYMDYLRGRMKHATRLTFADVFTPPHYRSRLVGLFLALLELIKGGEMRAEQPEPFGGIWLVAAGN